MYTIKGETKQTLVIEKSEFITYIKYVSTVNQAKEFIETIKQSYPDATHVVTAYQVGKTAEYGHQSDDGEPSGTAGLPVLDVFRKNDLTNFVCCVVRYFGGIKLGAGGLVRAYSKSASNALKELEIIPIVEYDKLILSFNYSFVSTIDIYLKDYNIISKSFGSIVKYIISIPTNYKNKVINDLIELTNNLIKIEIPNKIDLEDNSLEYQNNVDECLHFDE